MSDRTRTSLDNPAFRGRLRQPLMLAQSVRPQTYSDFGPRPRRESPAVAMPPVKPVAIPKTQAKPTQAPPVARATPKIVLVEPQPFARPAHPKQMQSKVLRRQAARYPQTPPAKSNEKTSAFRKYSKHQLALSGMACFIFMFGLAVSLLTLQTNRTVQAQVSIIADKNAQSDGAAAADAPPTETKPPAGSVASYQVAPDMPRHIKIAKFNVHARIKPMSVNNKNEMQAPASIYDAGWYTGSAKPGNSGSSGAMVINGHVHGPTTPGVFANLKKLIAGDVVEVTSGNNTTYEYKVVKTVSYKADAFDVAAVLSSVQPGVYGLNLITCSGPYDRASGEYTERTVVFTVVRS